MGQTESSKLPPVLAKLMDNLSSSSYRSPQAPNAVNNPVAPAVNVQELLSSIMVNTHRTPSSLLVAGWTCFSLQVCLSSSGCWKLSSHILVSIDTRASTAEPSKRVPDFEVWLRPLRNHQSCVGPPRKWHFKMSWCFWEPLMPPKHSPAEAHCSLVIMAGPYVHVEPTF